MTLILQAANNGIRVMDLTLPEDLQLIFDGFVGRLRNSPSLPRLGELYEMFDQPYHLPSLIQNAILAGVDSTLGTEFAEFIHQMYISWASDEYWASRTTTGVKWTNQTNSSPLAPKWRRGCAGPIWFPQHFGHRNISTAWNRNSGSSD